MVGKPSSIGWAPSGIVKHEYSCTTDSHFIQHMFSCLFFFPFVQFKYSKCLLFFFFLLLTCQDWTEEMWFYLIWKIWKVWHTVGILFHPIIRRITAYSYGQLMFNAESSVPYLWFGGWACSLHPPFFSKYIAMKVKVNKKIYIYIFLIFNIN